MTPPDVDEILNGKLKLSQSSGGYRFSIDPILLNNFFELKPGADILDIGTGVGIIPLLITIDDFSGTVTGVEIQKNLIEHARENLRLNDRKDSVNLICADILKLEKIEHFDQIISNPPFRKLHSGRINPHPEKAVARHEIKITLRELFNAAGSFLKQKGTFTLIHLYDRKEEMDETVRFSEFSLKRQRRVDSSEGFPHMILREYIKGRSGEVSTHSPLVISTPEGEYTKEVQNML